MLNVQFLSLEAPVALVVKLNGQLTVAETDNLESALRADSVQHAKLVVFDLQELTLISSIGIATLLAFQHDIHRLGGKVRYVVNSLVRLTFERAHIHLICEMHDSVDAACAAVPANGPTFNGRHRADRPSFYQNAQRGVGPLQRLVIPPPASSHLSQRLASFNSALSASVSVLKKSRGSE